MFVVRARLLILALLIVGALQMPLVAKAGAVSGSTSSASSAGRGVRDSTGGLCTIDNIDAAGGVSSPNWECGATLVGPTSLPLSKCPTSGVMGNTNQPLTSQILKQYLCTPAFTLSLDFTAQPTSPGTDDHGVPPLSLYSAGNTDEILQPGWCPANVTTGVCNSEASVPQRILVPRNTKPAPALLSIQGIPNNCVGAQTITSCDYQTSLTINLGGTTTVTHPKHSKSPLAISMTSTPGTFKLGVDQSGAITPANVSVAVTFTNKSKMRLKNISLIGLDPEPQDKTQALTPLALKKGTLPLRIGNLPSGAKVTKTFTLSVNGDGDYEWNALALFDDPNVAGGNGRSQATGGPFTSNVAPLYFSAKTEADNIFKQGGARYVDAGNPWYIKAEIKNESAYKTLCVFPIVPSLKGNAAAIGPHDITVASAKENAPPFAGILKPGDSATLEMYVGTAPDGSTRGEVSFSPKAATLGDGQSCTPDSLSSLTTLDDDDMTFAKDSTDFTVHVDTSQPVAPQISAGAKPLYFAGAFAAGSVEALFDSAVSLEAGVADAVSVQNLYSTLLQSLPAVAAAKTAIAEYQSLVTATDVLGYYWKTATPTEKQSFISQVQSVMRRETGDFWSAVSGTVSDAAAGYMNKVEAAYASGDDAQIIALYGRSLGSAVTQVITQVALAEVGQQIIAKAPALAKAFEEVAGSSVTIAALKEMPPGKILNPTEMRKLWGLSKQDLDAFSKIAKENDVLIGVRGRAPISVENLEEGAVWKHENLKPKNVSDVDVQYLGFPKSSLGTVQFRTYTFAEEHEILSAMQELPPAEYKVAYARYEVRLGESKYIKTIEGYSKAGEIDVGFNYADNGINITSKRNIRKFQLVEEKLPDGGTLYTPYQENLSLYSLRKTGTLPSMCKRALGSVLCQVTGDMDGVYVTSTSGGSVTQGKLIKVYKELANAGWQHPETLTWINDAGEFMFGAKQKILQGLELGGEALIQFAPDGKQYATYLDLAKSKLINADNYFLDIVGGYTKLAKAS
jgi:hypothetical protein